MGNSLQIIDTELISIIIPVYNAGKYIESTLNNLFSQTYQNFEIIIAYDEKSTDNSLQILNEINKKHKLIIDISNDTSPGAARNRGLSHAKGEYIVFIDSDDYIFPDYIASMLNVFNLYQEINVVCCGVLFINDTKIRHGLKIAKKSSNNIIIYERNDAIMLKIYDELKWGAWAHMIRKSFIIEHNILFPNSSAREDLVFTLKLFMNTDKIGYSSKIVYLYLKHSDSITANKFDKWWQLSQPSRKELAELSKELPPEAAEEILFRDQRLIAAGCACKYDYNRYISELQKYGVFHLSFYRGGDTIMGKISVIIFNISKYLYYKGIRHIKKI